MLETLRLSLKNIIRNKARSFLTMLGIIIGVASVILLVSVGQGLQLYITGQFEQLGANTINVLPGKVSLDEGFTGSAPNFAGSKLTLEMADDIGKLGGPIDYAAAESELPASVSYKGESKYTTVAGITTNYAQMINLQVEHGRAISDTDVDIGRKVVIIGNSIKEDLFGQSSALGKEVLIADERYEVVGILEDIGSASIGVDIDNFVAIPITSMQRLSGQDGVYVIAAKAKSKEDIEDAIDTIERYLNTKLKEDEFSVIDQSNLLGTITQILGVLTLALGGIAAISLVVGGVGIMNIMLVSVTERTREIGLRKAVGATPSNILTQFLIEATVLSVFGGAIGILIGWGGSLIINQFFPAVVTAWSVGLAFGVSAAVGIIFGVAPAIRASRLDPITALRYE
jgi:putative ABC transport system permease protein